MGHFVNSLRVLVFFFADGDLAAYREDPTCVAGFTLDAGRSSGPCRISPARITHVQADHVRGHVWWYVDLALDGGARTTSVEIEHNVRGDVWAGAGSLRHARPERDS
jgi:hypothetical protein